MSRPHHLRTLLGQLREAWTLYHATEPGTETAVVRCRRYAELQRQVSAARAELWAVRTREEAA